MAWTRFVLHCLTVAMLALGIASTPLYAVARAEDGTTAAQAHEGHTARIVPGTLDHNHVSPAKPHSVGQTCCHPGCIMAVVPGSATLATVLLPWVVVSIPHDPRGSPAAPSRIDRPPKYA